MADNEMSAIQMQLILQTIQSTVNQAVSSQTNSIIQSISNQINSEDYSNKLINLVEKITAVNSTMIQSQNEVRMLIEEQVVPSFEMVDFADSDLVKRTCKDIQEILHGEKYKAKDMIETLQESGVIKWIRNISIFIIVFLALMGAVNIIPKIYDFLKVGVSQ